MNFGILIFPQVEELDVIGPWEMFTMWKQVAQGPETCLIVAEQAKGCTAVLSVCTGAFILHAAGLLSGKRATTHWASLQRLRALGDVAVVEERFVHDGGIWSSAGVSAGIDLALEFIASAAGPEATHAKAPAYALRR